MKIIAVDLKIDDGSFFKKWETIRLTVHPYTPSDKNLHELAIQGGVLCLMHQRALSQLTDKLLDEIQHQKSWYTLVVQEGGCGKTNESSDSKFHYSQVSFKNNEDLSCLTTRINTLAAMLSAATSEADIRKAWRYWECPSLEQIIEILSPMYLMPESEKISALVGREINALLKEMNDVEINFIIRELEKISEPEAAKTGAESMKRAIRNRVAHEFSLVKWLPCLPDFARRYL